MSYLRFFYWNTYRLRFWLDDIALEIVKMVTFNGCMIWYIIDILSAKERAKNYNFKKFTKVTSMM
jgi:hypothetical protein